MVMMVAVWWWGRMGHRRRPPCPCSRRRRCGHGRHQRRGGGEVIPALLCGDSAEPPRGQDVVDGEGDGPGRVDQFDIFG